MFGRYDNYSTHCKGISYEVEKDFDEHNFASQLSQFISGSSSSNPPRKLLKTLGSFYK